MKLQLSRKEKQSKKITLDPIPKKKKKSTEFTYSYSIIPTNFINISEESQVQRLGQFFDILNVIDDKIKITMSRRIIPITVEGQIQNMPVMQVHVESHVPLADTLEQNRLEYISGVNPPQFRILKEHFSMLEIVETELKDNDDVTLTTGEKLFSKTFTLDGIPATLPYAWITKIFGICSQIQMWYNPLDKDDAITRMVRFKNIIYDDAKNNRITSELYKRADNAENSIRKDSTRLYEVIVNCTVVGDTRKSLKENVKTFKKHLKRYGGHFSAVSAKQAAMLLEGFGKKITFDRGSCAILYSFASADMLEIPDGIPLGINMDSKGSIIFDIGKRTNYNIAVIGKSGSGKSFTVKILLNRLLKKFPDSYVYVIDPMGEYSRIADYFGGMDVLYLKDEKDQLGLDPFVLLDPLDAADILAEITNASDDVKRQFQTYCGKAKSFPICSIPERIPVHLQKISNTEMFQLFSEKYSQHEIELIIVDERFADSDIHYAFLAKTDNGNKTALTFFDVNSCTDRLTNDYDYYISCNDKKQNEQMSSIKQKHVIISLEHEEFCTIPLSPMHQSFYDYGKIFSDKIDEIEEKIISEQAFQNNNNRDSSSTDFSLDLPRMQLLRNLAWGIAYETIEEQDIQKKIQEYNVRYGNLPLKLQELLDSRDLSSESKKKGMDTTSNDNDNDEKKYSNLLSEINQQAIIYQKNENSTKFNEQILLMQQKQKEIATKILGVNISTVYIDENWNFPFIDISGIEPLPGIEPPLPPICNIPENIPIHLEKIQNSEMFSLFSGKYSHNDIEFEISDERRHNAMIHYSIRAMSEDQNRTASIFFHLDSCTGKISVPYNLDCSENIQDENSTHIQTRFIDEIEKSLDNKEFCVIKLEPWHQKMHEYHTEIGEQLKQLTIDFEPKNNEEEISQEDLFEFHLEFQRLGLLNDLVRSATSGTLEDENTPELILEYKDKYDSLPDEFVQLLEMTIVV